MRSEKRNRVLAVGIVPYELDLPGVRDGVVTPGTADGKGGASCRANLHSAPYFAWMSVFVVVVVGLIATSYSFSLFNSVASIIGLWWNAREKEEA